MDGGQSLALPGILPGQQGHNRNHGNQRRTGGLNRAFSPVGCCVRWLDGFAQMLGIARAPSEADPRLIKDHDIIGK